MNTNSRLYKELTYDEIREIVKANFHTDILLEAKLLDGGLFNTTYKIYYGEDKIEIVLRCGPVNRHLLMAFEENLMQAEKHVYQLCEANNVPCSHVLVCDTTKKIIDRDYMIVEYIDGIPLSNQSLNNDQKAKLYYQVGEYMKTFHSITNKQFGRASYIVAGKSYSSWYGYLIAEINDITDRSRKYHAFTESEIALIKSVFINYRVLLDEITVSQLVHTDLWEGNVLISETDGEYKVAAIIDADRAIFGDVDFEFASPWMINDDFLKGYNPDFDIVAFNSEDRKTRRKIYQMLYYIIEAYVGIAEYNNEKQYKDNKKLVLDLASELI